MNNNAINHVTNISYFNINGGRKEGKMNPLYHYLNLDETSNISIISDMPKKTAILMKDLHEKSVLNSTYNMKNSSTKRSSRSISQLEV